MWYILYLVGLVLCKLGTAFIFTHRSQEEVEVQGQYTKKNCFVDRKTFASPCIQTVQGTIWKENIPKPLLQDILTMQWWIEKSGKFFCLSYIVKCYNVLLAFGLD